MTTKLSESTPVSACGLRVTAANALDRDEWRPVEFRGRRLTLGDMTNFYADDLLTAVLNFGHTSLNKLREVMREAGLFLKGEGGAGMTNAQMREASGVITSREPLANFLYLLIRDHLPAGVVERVMMDCEQSIGQDVQFTNGWVAQYALNLTRRLTPHEDR